MNNPQNKLPKEFYEQELHTVAKNLLGKLFVRKLSEVFLAAKIVEVEAYDGSLDEASHSFNGKTKRNDVMFKGGGLLYVYFTYGMHYCANVVTGKVGDGKAILIRAVEPLNNIDLMSLNRNNRKDYSPKELINLTNGPAKFAQAFQLTKAENGEALFGEDIFILNSGNISESEIITTTRIGIKKSVDLPWRYYIKDNPFVSKR